MITLLRTMTLKSPMKFGKWYDLTVGDIINSKGYYGIDYLVWVYYSASKISFNDEVLNILGIIDESQLIEKPGNLENSKELQKIATDFVKKREHEQLGDEKYILKVRKGKHMFKKDNEGFERKQKNGSKKFFSKSSLKNRNQNGK